MFKRLFNWIFRRNSNKNRTAKINKQQKTMHWGKEPADVDIPDWKLIAINKKGITVKWKEKYGNWNTVFCIGLWETNNEYMLTFKDKPGSRLIKSNVSTIGVI